MTPYRLPHQHPDFPAFEDLFAAALCAGDTIETRVAGKYGLEAKDVAGEYFDAWERVARRWKPGRADPRAAVGGRFATIMKTEHGERRRLICGQWVGVSFVDPEELEQLAGEADTRAERSEGFEDLAEAMRCEGKAGRSARRWRAKQIERALACGDLFAGEGVLA